LLGRLLGWRRLVRWLSGRMRYAVTEWPWWAEAALLVVLAVTAVQPPAGPGLLSDRRWVAEQLLALAACASLLLRRRYPIAVALVASAVFLFNPQTLWPLVVALYELASRRGVALALGIGFLDVAFASSGLRLALGLPTVQYGPAAVLVVPVALGFAARNRQHRLGALTDQVDRLRVERELRDEQARSAERARIAQEMHDLLAHRLSLLALQAGVLELRGRELPEPLPEPLVARLSQLLGVLHEQSVKPVGADPAALRTLLDEARAAGAEVTDQITAALATVPAPVRLAVYRIVREALTNARRHAPGAPVTVTVDHRYAMVHLLVANPVGTGGPGAPDGPSGGYGLVGLAERVAALDGTFTAGVAGDRFEVRATLPARIGQGEDR
jgi:signal transduction histidine kinase